jgi:hypothetical protein
MASVKLDKDVDVAKRSLSSSTIFLRIDLKILQLANQKPILITKAERRQMPIAFLAATPVEGG